MYLVLRHILLEYNKITLNEKFNFSGFVSNWRYEVRVWLSPTPAVAVRVAPPVFRACHLAHQLLCAACALFGGSVLPSHLSH